MIEGLACGQPLTDRAFGANRLHDILAEAEIEAIIELKAHRRFPAEYNRKTCKWRHLIERIFKNNINKKEILLMQNQGKLQRVHLARGNRHRFEMNVSRPKASG